MHVRLTPELESLIHAKVETGRYSSASEVIDDALRLMAARDRLQDLQSAAFREQIAAGLASLHAGKGADGEAFLASLDAGLAQDKPPAA